MNIAASASVHPRASGMAKPALRRSSPSAPGDPSKLTDKKETLKGYLLLINTFLDDSKQRDALDRSLSSVNDLLGGTSEEDVGAVLRRIFGGGASGRVATRLSDAVAQFMSRLRVSISARGSEASGEEETKIADPLVLDLGGDGVQTTGVASGVAFDVTGDGRSKQVSFVSGNDALLTLDRNGNGIVDDGRELFGDRNGAANGFLELARYDEDRNGQIDAHDAIYNRLKVFQDLNGDGVSQAGELKDLKAAGIAAISVRFEGIREEIGGGDQIAQRSFFTRIDGSKGRAVDLLLRYKNRGDREDRRMMDVQG